MLGKLAKWLRMLGYDTVYIPGADDDELVRIAVREDRILLTRDRPLSERRMVRMRSVFVDWGTTSQQIRQVVDALGLELSEDRMFTVCTVCNGAIVPVEKSEVADRIPPHVYQTLDDYGRCPNCDRIYWRGTHVQHVLEALRNAEKGANAKPRKSERKEPGRGIV